MEKQRNADPAAKFDRKGRYSWDPSRDEFVVRNVKCLLVYNETSVDMTGVCNFEK